MLEKLENFMGFIFKIAKWIIMLLFIVFVVILFRSCSQTVDVMENAKNNALQNKQEVSKTTNNDIENITPNVKIFDCNIEDWKFQKTSSQYITVDGTTTCNSGKLVLKIYDGDTSSYIGNDTTYIRNGIFKSLIRTSLSPSRLEIKFTILNR